MALPPKKRQLPVSLVLYSDDEKEKEEEEDPSLRPRKQATPAKVEEEEAAEAGATSPVRGVEAAPTTEKEEEWEPCWSSSEDEWEGSSDEEESGSSPESPPGAIPPARRFSSSSLRSLPAPGYPGLIQKPIRDRRGERAMAGRRYPPLTGGTYLRPKKPATPAEANAEDAASMPPPSIGGTPPPLASGIPAGAPKKALEEEGGSTNVAAEDVDKLAPQPLPLIGSMESISALAAHCQTEDPIILEKIKMIIEDYAAFRQVRGDGNCFYRSFTFSYLEHIRETQDRVEIQRLSSCIKESMRRWQISLHEKDNFESFWDLVCTSIVREGMPWSRAGLLAFCRQKPISDAREKNSLHGIFRHVISAEMRRREEFFKPFVLLEPGETMDLFYASAVEQMGQECDHVQIMALTDAIRVPIRVVYLDRSLDRDGSLALNHHDFFPSAESSRAGSSSTATSGPSRSGRPTVGAIALNPPGNVDAAKDSDSRRSRSPVPALNTPLNLSRIGAHLIPQSSGQTTSSEPPSSPPVPFVTLLYRPGHYEILYPRSFFLGR